MKKYILFLSLCMCFSFWTYAGNTYTKTKQYQATVGGDPIVLDPIKDMELIQAYLYSMSGMLQIGSDNKSYIAEDFTYNTETYSTGRANAQVILLLHRRQEFHLFIS